MIAATIDIGRLRRLLAEGAQLVEVLRREGEEYVVELHLPGVINVPLQPARHNQSPPRRRAPR